VHGAGRSGYAAPGKEAFMSRLLCLSLLGAAWLLPCAARAAEGGVTVTPVLSAAQDLSGQPIVFPPHDGQVIASVFDIAPGAVLPAHLHPWPRLAYVLQGSLRVVNHTTGRTDIFKAGDFIVESVGHWHQGANDSHAPLKLLVIDLVPKGAGNTTLKP
jgi:quercetin dioxygenase-like cupin family protein